PVVTVTVKNAPTVSLTAPTRVSGTASILTSASAAAGVVGVSLYLDNSLIKTYSDAKSIAEGLSYPWDSTLAANGTHSLQAKATDPSGAIGSSALVAVTVNNAPTVSLTAPASVTGMASIHTSASAAAGVVGVNLYLDNSLIETY